MIPIVIVADYRVEIGLTVSLSSALRNLGSGFGLDIHLMSGGIGRGTINKIRKTLDAIGRPYKLSVVEISDERFRNFRRFANTSLFTYARFLIPEMFPDLSKVLYLDVDILVLDDLAALYQTPLEGKLVAASIDRVVERADHKWGILNHQELGIPGNTPYFSAGILIMDLCLWRDRRFAEECMDYAAKHAEICLWWDQTVMNSLIAGEFTKLDDIWNQQLTVKPERYSIVGIIHFAGPDKPWNFSPNLPQPLLDLYFQEIDRTAFAGWRPRISFYERLRRKCKKTFLGY
jgi:lipopolysaccharide biosynthesis glycosyltransferase